MAYAVLDTSPLLPGVSPVEIFYREYAPVDSKVRAVDPILFLHGGWGYEMYPADHQIAALSKDYPFIVPDRSGYGRSTRPITEFPRDFHYRAASETVTLMDSLGIERAVFWGHSDGAVIAAIIGFTAAQRVKGLIVEAIHYYAQKPRSRDFFETLAGRPELVSADLRCRFAQVLGSDEWRALITTHSTAWLQLAKDSNGPDDDLYGGRLHEITVPTLIIHGLLDPRTEPSELDDLRLKLPSAEMHILERGSHSPHSESATAHVVTSLAKEFLAKI